MYYPHRPRVSGIGFLHYKIEYTTTSVLMKLSTWRSRPARYQASPHQFRETLPDWQYAPDVRIRKVDRCSRISWSGHRFKVGQAFQGRQVGVCSTTTDGVFAVYFRNTKINTMNLHNSMTLDT